MSVVPAEQSDFGATLTAAEVDWRVAHEFVRTAEDVIWRGTGLGLRMTTGQIDSLRSYMNGRALDNERAAAAATAQLQE